VTHPPLSDPTKVARALAAREKTAFTLVEAGLLSGLLGGTTGGIQGAREAGEGHRALGAALGAPIGATTIPAGVAAGVALPLMLAAKMPHGAARGLVEGGALPGMVAGGLGGAAAGGAARRALLDRILPDEEKTSSPDMEKEAVKPPPWWSGVLNEVAIGAPFGAAAGGAAGAAASPDDRLRGALMGAGIGAGAGAAGFVGRGTLNRHGRNVHSVQLGKRTPMDEFGAGITAPPSTAEKAYLGAIDIAGIAAPYAGIAGAAGIPAYLATREDEEKISSVDDPELQLRTASCMLADAAGRVMAQDLVKAACVEEPEPTHPVLEKLSAPQVELLAQVCLDKLASGDEPSELEKEAWGSLIRGAGRLARRVGGGVKNLFRGTPTPSKVLSGSDAVNILGPRAGVLRNQVPRPASSAAGPAGAPPNQLVLRHRRMDVEPPRLVEIEDSRGQTWTGTPDVVDTRPSTVGATHQRGLPDASLSPKAPWKRDWTLAENEKMLEAVKARSAARDASAAARRRLPSSPDFEEGELLRRGRDLQAPEPPRSQDTPVARAAANRRRPGSLDAGTASRPAAPEGPVTTKTMAAAEEAAAKAGVPLKNYLIGLGLMGGGGALAYGMFRNPQPQQESYYR